jgi:hypothetical protein
VNESDDEISAEGIAAVQRQTAELLALDAWRQLLSEPWCDLDDDELLGMIDQDDDVGEQLIDLAKDGTPPNRRLCAAALFLCHSPGWYATLEWLLTDPDGGVRGTAAFALSALGASNGEVLAVRDRAQLLSARPHSSYFNPHNTRTPGSPMYDW